MSAGGDEWPIGGYAIDLENRDELLATQTEATYRSLGDIPAEVDPRKHPLWSQGWMKVFNQGSVGSCQGCALVGCMEYCYGLFGPQVAQLSCMYAYLTSQMASGIRGDSGSTLNGGTKAAKDGICSEEVGPYPGRYPGHGWVTSAMREDAKNYRMNSHSVMRSADEIKAFIGSGIGIVQIGIGWAGMNPDANGCIRSYGSGGGGGHSVVLAGYGPDSTVGSQSSAGYWILLQNSWGTRWGQGGFCWVDPRAVNQMISRGGTFIGRSDMVTPGPRDIDWTKERIFV
jgi:hypothetical protein